MAYKVTKGFARRALAALEAPLKDVDENERPYFRIYGVTMDHPRSSGKDIDEFDTHVIDLTISFRKRSAGDKEFGIITRDLISGLHRNPPITENEVIQELRKFYQKRSCDPS